MMSKVLKRWRAWCCAGLILMLSACATPSRIAQDGTAEAFNRTGRFALSVNYADGKRDAVQGGFAWQDTDNRLILDLTNPLGNTLARVQVETGRATMVRSNGEREEAASPDELVDRVLGSPIPVAGLRDWLRGRTGEQPVATQEKGSNGELASFTQQGWRVQLSRYDALGPRLLVLNRNDPNRSISARLVIDE